MSEYMYLTCVCTKSLSAFSCLYVDEIPVLVLIRTPSLLTNTGRTKTVGGAVWPVEAIGERELDGVGLVGHRTRRPDVQQQIAYGQ